MKLILPVAVFSSFFAMVYAHNAHAKRITNPWSNDYFDVNIKGRLHLDAATYDSDNQSLKGNADVRRARINLYGDINDEWRYVFENNFNDKYWNVEKVYLNYKPHQSQWNFRFGQQKVPSGLEHMESSNAITFIERAAVIDALARGLRGGVTTKYVADDWSFHAGVFDERWGQVSTDDEGWEMATRLTYLPLGYDHNIVHLGVSAAREFPDEDSRVRFRARPESALTNSYRSVDTGTLSNVKHNDKIGLEFMSQWNLFTLQGEYIQSHIERDAGAEDLTFDGWYAEAGYVLSGEQRLYSASKGHLSGIKPTKAHRISHGGMGAWHVAARYSALDINDGAVRGGEMNNVTLGVNWYPDLQWRVMLNQAFIDTDEFAVTPNDNPKVTSLRIQYSF